MRRFRKEFGLKKARILRERLIPVSQRLKIGINRHPLFMCARRRAFLYSPCSGSCLPALPRSSMLPAW